MDAIEAPIIVTIRGRDFTVGGVIIVGRLKHWDERSQPAIIVPAARRINGLYRLGFSSFIGFTEGFLGVLRKQKDIIRKLYPAVNRVAMIAREYLTRLLGDRAIDSSIRSLE